MSLVTAASVSCCSPHLFFLAEGVGLLCDGEILIVGKAQTCQSTRNCRLMFVYHFYLSLICSPTHPHRSLYHCSHRHPHRRLKLNRVLSHMREHLISDANPPRPQKDMIYYMVRGVLTIFFLVAVAPFVCGSEFFIL